MKCITLLLIVLLGCSWAASDATDRPEAVQRLPVEYKEAFDLLPSGPWARMHYKEAFGDYDPNQWGVMEEVYKTRVCSYLMWDLVGSNDFEGLIDFDNDRCDLDKVLAVSRASTNPPPSEEQYQQWVESDRPTNNVADRIRDGLKK